MSLFLSLAICFIPLIVGITICLIFVKEFKVVYALLAILFGLIAIILIIVVRTAVNDLSELVPLSLQGYVGLLITVILFALIEELVKMVLIFLFPKKIDSLEIFMITCLMLGCTVGSFETVMYLVTGISETIPRLFTAVVVHMLCALLSGFFVWASRKKYRFVRAFLMSFVLHGIYNYFAGLNTFLWWFSIVTILFALMKCRIYYATFKEKQVSETILS